MSQQKVSFENKNGQGITMSAVINFRRISTKSKSIRQL